MKTNIIKKEVYSVKEVEELIKLLINGNHVYSIQCGGTSVKRWIYDHTK